MTSNNEHTEQQLTSAEEEKLLAFSKSELENLAEKVSKAIKHKEAEERQGMITLIEDLARQANIGVEFYDLESRKKELPIQYRHPDNPSQTWRGRGIMPRWLQDEIAKGRKKEDFKI
ncbi:MAG TPA: histone [Cytophagales bacterium]|jgi:DNA-binding protein H-NS|nr:histone [Cytophagales bacterium]